MRMDNTNEPEAPCSFIDIVPDHTLASCLNKPKKKNCREIQGQFIRKPNIFISFKTGKPPFL